MNGSPQISAPCDYAIADQYLLGTFEPQPDITAYELAIILPMILHGMTRERYDALGPMQRHIRLAS